MASTNSVRVRTDLPKSFFDSLEREALRQLIPYFTETAQEIKEEAIKITAASGMVTNRPPSRRRHPDAPHYIDSWEVGATDLSGGRIRLTIRNTHPFARGLDKGSPPHPITPSTKNHLAFPIATSDQGGSQYATETPPYRFTEAVDHPGSDGFEITEEVSAWAAIFVRSPDVRVRFRTTR